MQMKHLKNCPLLQQHDRGAVTAEFAIVLPTVIVIVSVLCSLVRFVDVSIRCHDAASAVARSLVIEGKNADIDAVAMNIVGTHTTAAYSLQEGIYRVTISCPILPDAMNILPMSVTSKATSVAVS